MSHFKIYILGGALILLSFYFIFPYFAIEVVEYPENRGARRFLLGIAYYFLIASAITFSVFVFSYNLPILIKLALVLLVSYISYSLYTMPYSLTYTESRFYLENYYLYSLVVGIVIFAIGGSILVVKGLK